jgi:hypothetical protein
MTLKPTENGEAYLAFVQAHDLSCAFEDSAKLKQSGSFISAPSTWIQTSLWPSRAIRNWKAGCCAHTRPHRNTAKKRAAWPSGLCSYNLICRKLTSRSGFSYYYGDNNYDAALREFEIAQRGLPNESDAYLAIGASSAARENGRNLLQISRNQPV